MITNKYILFSQIPLLKDSTGTIYCDPFWAKELRMHLEYIADLSLCCPVIEAANESELPALKKLITYSFGEVEDISQYHIKALIPLNYCKGWFSTFKNFIPNFIKVKNVLKPDCIAHSDGAGWPFPLSFYLLPLSFFKTFKWIVVIESTFMMITKGEKFSFRKFLSHHIHNLLLPLCLNRADARIFTHDHYKNMFLKSNERVHVSEYSNLDQEFLINEIDVENKNEALKNRKLRFIIACRLIADKGVVVLLDAVKALQKMGVPAQIDIMGSGELEPECRQFIQAQQGAVTMSFVDPVAYGKDFFKYLSTYDVLLLPNLSEEQPRIIFDAFGQGLTIVASDTDGLKQVCKHEVNAIVFKRGDAQALTNAIEFAVNNTDKVVKFGLAGLAFAKTKTHQQMHRDREQFLIKVFS